MVGGADYWPEKGRWRRKGPEAPTVSPLVFTRGMARRVEGQMRHDWAFVPALRNLLFRWLVRPWPAT